MSPDATPLHRPPADPVAALAEAMYDRDTWGGSLYWYKQEATAIFAALDAAGYAVVPKDRLVAELFAPRPSDAAEIARLRKIEEAAREWADADFLLTQMAELPDSHRSLKAEADAEDRLNLAEIALRAALAGGPDD